MEEVEMLGHVVTPSCSLEDDDILQRNRQIRNQFDYCQLTTAATSSTMTSSSIVTNSSWLDKLYSGSSISQSDWNVLSSQKEMNEIPFLLCDDLVVDNNENESDDNVSFNCMKNNLQKNFNFSGNKNNDNNTATTTTLPLVRIRGMVQDIFDPEFIEINARRNNQQQQQQFIERIPLLITPIPSTCPWFRSMCMNNENNKNESNSDSSIDNINNNNNCANPCKKEQEPNNKRLKSDCDNESSTNDTRIKSSDDTMDSKDIYSNTLDDTRIEDTIIEASIRSSLNSNKYTTNFRTDRVNSNCTDQIDNDRWWNSRIMNSEQRQIPVVAKLYYDQYPNVIEQLRLNNVIDCIGILEWESNDDDNNEDDDDNNNNTTNDNNTKQQQDTDMKTDRMEDNLESLFDDDQYATSRNDFDLEKNHLDEIVAPPNCIPRLHIVWLEQISLEDCYATNISSNTTTTCTTTEEVEQPNGGTVQTTSNNNKTPQRLLQHLIGNISYVVATSIWMTLLSMAERGNNNNNNNNSNNNNDDDSSALSALSLPTITPHGTTLGCASLNVIVSSIASAKQIQDKLYSVLSDIVPVLYNFEITNTTIKSCSNDTMPENELPPSILSVPQKMNGRTIPSIWQFPKGSTIIVNISSLNSNNFVSNDIKNIIQLLQMVSYKHSIQYTFDGNIQIPFEADVRIIVLSTATNKDELLCMLNVVQYDTNYNYNNKNCNRNYKIDTDEKKLDQEKNENVESDYNDHDDDDSDDDELDIEYDCSSNVVVDKNNDIKMYLRQLLANCRCTLIDKNNNNRKHTNNNIQLSKLLLQRAKDDFIGRRQKWQQQQQQQQTKNQLQQGQQQQQILHHQPGEDDFHRWLTLCRLVARNRQSTVAYVCDWDIALQIDDDMQQTLLLLK